MEKIKLQALAKHYYSRHDIQKALVEQAKHCEVVPRYYDCFGRRPDTIEYENDIASLVLKGATSFHCSEELWSNPLELSTSMSTAELERLRIGWNLLLDVDCKFLEYSKIAAWLLCEALYFHGVQNFGLKFSGGSGWHIGLAFSAFPPEINQIKVKNFFPQGPRMIASYLKKMIEQDLAQRMLELSTFSEIIQVSNKPRDYFMKMKCRKCGLEPVKKRVVEIEKGIIKEREELLCLKCGASYLHDKNNFLVYDEFNPFSVLEIDTVLIAPRHLYRMAYSLHEKTSLASIVIKPEQLKAFHPGWAKPERVFVKPFLQEPEAGEARELFIQALDWYAKKQERIEVKREKEKDGKRNETKTAGTKVKIERINEEIFPPCIRMMLQGLKHDGRKRALFVLINFFKSLGLDVDEIENKIKAWNVLNYRPLKESYITTQLRWFKRQETRLPPNCNMTVYYQDIGACMPDALCSKIKNPVNYVLLKVKDLDKRENERSKKRKTKVF